MREHVYETNFQFNANGDTEGWLGGIEKQLGLMGALRFLLQYEKGEGDYTKLRKELFKNETVESLIGKMKKEGEILKL